MEDHQHKFANKFQAVSDKANLTNDIISASSNTRESVVTATSHTVGNVNPGNTSFQHQLSPSIVLDRTVYLRAQVQCTITTSRGVADSNIAHTRGVCLAQAPLSRVMKSLNIRLNNNSLSCEPHQWSRALLKLHDSADLRRLNSLSPMQPDPYNNMTANQIAGGANIDNDFALVAGAPDEHCSPDSPYADVGSSAYSQSRCMFRPSTIAYTAVAGANPGTTVLTFTITEPLYHPWLSNSTEIQDTLARIQTMNVDITWNNLNAMFTFAQNLCRERDGADAAFTVQGFQNSAELLIRQYVPVIKIPPVVKTKFMNIHRRSFNITGMALQDAVGSVNTGSIRLSQTPHKLVIFARPRADVVANNVSDAFGAITGLTMRTDADSGNFASATPQQLWEMSARNGCNQTFTQWRYHQGSVLVIDFTKGDVSGYIAGVRRDFTFELDVTLQNTQYERFVGRNFLTPSVGGGPPAVPLAGQDAQWDLYVLAFMDASLISDGTVTSIESGFSPDVALATLRNDPTVADPDALALQLTGGGFWGSLKKIGKSVASRVGNRLIDAGVARMTGGGVQTGGGLRVYG